MKSKKTKVPQVALKRSVNGTDQFYVASNGTGTQFVQSKWVGDFNSATHYPSKYAAKQALDRMGMGPEDCIPHTL